MKKLIAFFSVIAILLAGCTQTITAAGDLSKLTEQDRLRYDAVVTYMNNALKYGRDTFKGKKGGKTPLFFNGIDIRDKSPVVWTNLDKKSYPFSNFASQTNFMRTLVGLSNISGDPKYKKAAAEATEFMYKNFRSKNGLLYWGGHAAIDLSDNSIWVPSSEAKFHEVKQVAPYWDFMYEVDPEVTSEIVERMWQAHFDRWDILEFSRHAYFTKTDFKGSFDLPDQDFKTLFPTRKLTYMCSAVDFIYAAVTDYKQTGNENALRWAKNLFNQYVNIRDPETKMFGYMYNYYMTNNNTDALTLTPVQNDRLFLQIGHDFDENATEPNLLDKGYAANLYTKDYQMLLSACKLIGKDQSKDILIPMVESLKSFYKYAYIRETGMIKPILVDGTDLSGYKFNVEGYWESHMGDGFEQYPVNTNFLKTYVQAYLLSGDSELWEMAREIASFLKIGEIGDGKGNDISLNKDIKNNNPQFLFTLLDLYAATGSSEYLDMARVVGDNILKTKYHNGYFTESDKHPLTQFDNLYVLSLLKLHSYIVGAPELVDDYTGGEGFTQGDQILPNGEEKRWSSYEPMIYKTIPSK